MLRRRLIFVRSLLLGAIFVSICAPLLCAQQPASAPAPQKSDSPAGPITTLSLDAHLVNLPVIVRDKKGAIIQNLTKDDFTLSVDGKGVTIRYFDKDNDLPLTLGLLVDISGSVRNTLDDERTASSSFIDQMITAPAGRQADRAFVMQFGQQTELLQDVTPSRPKLQAAIKELGSTDPNANSQPSDPNDPNGNNGGARRRGGTTLYDAVFLAADELLSKQKGRKAIILLTDGDDNGSRESLNRCIEAAQRADTIIYAIYFKGSENNNNNNQQQQRRGGGGGFPGGRGGIGFPGGGGGGYPGGGGGGRPGGGGQQQTRVDGKKILERMVGETGGRVFEESKKQDFAAIYDQIAEELRSQYRLGFTPDQTNMEDGYHRVILDLPKKKDLKIQTRDGYYTGK